MSFGLEIEQLKSMLGTLYEKGLPEKGLRGEYFRLLGETQPLSILDEIEQKKRTLQLGEKMHWSDVLILRYVNEVLLSESRSEQRSKGDGDLRQGDETSQDVICAHVVDDKWLDVTNALEEIYGDRSPKMIIKFQNLRAELHRLFFSECPQAASPTILSTGYVRELHRNLTKKLLDSDTVGAYRKSTVGPSGTDLKYLSPELISSYLETLLNFVNEEAKKIPDNDENEQTGRFILLGALLFSKFLYIHPFRNGNGRVARLLLNTFLSKACIVVPFSLYLDRHFYSKRLTKKHCDIDLFKLPRKCYLDLLENATRYPTEHDPILDLALHTLFCIQQAYLDIS